MQDLEAFKNDDGWQCAFQEAIYHQHSSRYDPKDRGPVEDIIDIVAADEGIGDEKDWVAIVQLKDGRFAVMNAGCDYTGWD